MPDSELDRIDPQPLIIKLQSGLEVQVVRMRTRQFFRFLKVLTAAGPAVISTLNFNDPEFGARLLAVLMFAIPQAENEAVEFVQSMVRPAHLHELEKRSKKKLTDDQQKDNAAKWDQLSDDLFNPELRDTIDIIKAVISQEAPEMQALGKELMELLTEVTRNLPGTTKETTPDDDSETSDPVKTGT